MSTGATVVEVGLLVDAHATTTTLATCTVTTIAAGAGAIDTGFVGRTGVATLSTVVSIALDIGAGVATAGRGVA